MSLTSLIEKIRNVPMKDLYFLYCMDNISLLKPLKGWTINHLTDDERLIVGTINAFKTAGVSDLFVKTKKEQECITKIFACTQWQSVEAGDAKTLLFAVARFYRHLRNMQEQVVLQFPERGIHIELIQTFDAFNLWKHL